MTKQALQKELQTKVKPGIKPSQLKRSKSLENIPVAPLPEIPLKRTLSQPEAIKQPNLSQQIKQLKQELAFSQQTAQNYLTNLQTVTAQLDQKEQQLEQVNADWLKMAQKQTDNLKASPNPRLTELQTELEQTITDATQEITRLENQNKQLRTKLTRASNQIQDLKRQLKLTNSDLNSHQRAAELRINEPQSAYT